MSTTRFYGPRPVKGRSTGRQMFEADASLAFSDAAAMEESDRTGGGGGGAGDAGGPIDASLFAGEEDLEDEDDSDWEEGDEDEDEEEEEE